jgi:kynurenine formamidase
MAEAAAASLSYDEFRTLYERLRDGVPWGPQDRRGTLNNLTPDHVVAAAGLVSTGRTVSLAGLVEHEATADNPTPWTHEITLPAAGPDLLDFALDTLALHVHGNADSHIDALSHVSFDGSCYNDVPADLAGVTELSICNAKDGIVGRGVLLDVPRQRGCAWLEPGDHVTAADLTAAESAQRVRVGTGDLVFVRVGHRRRRAELGPWDAASARTGLHPEAVELLADRRVAVLGSDGNNDTAPSPVADVGFPVHVLAIRAIGLPLLDYLQLEELAAACETVHRWSFLCVIAPLRLPRGTGSPVNPIAVF